MSVTSLHVLLTYLCNYECDHCFVWGSPRQSGVFTLEQLEEVFDQALQVPGLGQFYFEGGESFVYYPVLLKAVRRATELGFATGVVTNGYWATSRADARAWLAPLAEAGLNQLEISCDPLHGDEPVAPAGHTAVQAAADVGLPASLISLEIPDGRDESGNRGEPVTGGGIMFRGRAAAMLAQRVAGRPWQTFNTCPYEDLVAPRRIHLDPFGYLHLCQGVTMGNLFERPLADILADYRPAERPVVRELVAGGPARLVTTYGLTPAATYADACQLCYTARESLRASYPKILAPDQMYGVTA